MPDIEEEFIRDCWYVAGWSGDFTHALTPLRILDEPIVVFRTEAGVPAALEQTLLASEFLPLVLLNTNEIQAETLVAGIGRPQRAKADDLEKQMRHMSTALAEERTRLAGVSLGIFPVDSPFRRRVLQ